MRQELVSLRQLRLLCWLAVSIASLAQIPVVSAQTRTWTTWPFSSSSPWNMPVGSGAKFSAIQFGNSASGSAVTSWKNLSTGINWQSNTTSVVIASSSDYQVELYDNRNLSFSGASSGYNNSVWYYSHTQQVPAYEFCYAYGTDASNFLVTSNFPNPSNASTFYYVGNQWSTTYGQASGMNSTPNTPSNTVSITSDYSQTFYIPSGICGSPDSDGLMSVIQPNHFAVDLYAPIVLPNSTPPIVIAHAVGSYYDLTGDGTGYWNGRRASMIPTLAGIIRAGELASGTIPHAVSVVMSPTALSDVGGPVWPAYTFDTNDGYANCTGCLSMGALLAVPPTVDVTSLGLSAAGLTLAKAAQNYGVYVVDRGGVGGVTFLAELNDPDTMPTTGDLKIIKNNLKRIKNNSSSNVGGGGTPGGPLAPPFSD